ncbi:MAG: JAB domain-containing protein, partial [Pseudomonadota bacterium]
MNKRVDPVSEFDGAGNPFADAVNPFAGEASGPDEFADATNPFADAVNPFAQAEGESFVDGFVRGDEALYAQALKGGALLSEKLGFKERGADMLSLAKAYDESSTDGGYVAPHGDVGLDQFKNMTDPEWWKMTMAETIPGSVPFLAGAAGGGAAGFALGGPAGALIGATLGGGGTAFAQELGSSYYEYMDAKQPDWQESGASQDVSDAAIDFAIKRAGLTGVINAASVPLSLVGGPTTQPLKYALMQSLGIQPAIGVVDTVAQNAIQREIDPDQPLSQGVAASYAGEALFEGPATAAVTAETAGASVGEAIRRRQGRPDDDLSDMMTDPNPPGDDGSGGAGADEEMHGGTATPEANQTAVVVDGLPFDPNTGEILVDQAFPQSGAPSAIISREEFADHQETAAISDSLGADDTVDLLGEESSDQQEMVAISDSLGQAIPIEAYDEVAPQPQTASIPPGIPAQAANANAQEEDREPAAEDFPATLSDIDSAAHEAATSPLNDLPEPTQAQIEAGNYKKGHIQVGGMDITVENPKGSVRSGVDPDGKEWSFTMQSHYGYILKTTGADGEHVDVFVGEDTDSRIVYLIDQVNKDGTFDEHKAMIGYPSNADAVQAYLENYDEDWMLGPVSMMSSTVFDRWLEHGDTTIPYSNALRVKVLDSERADQPESDSKQDVDDRVNVEPVDGDTRQLIHDNDTTVDTEQDASSSLNERAYLLRERFQGSDAERQIIDRYDPADRIGLDGREPAGLIDTYVPEIKARKSYVKRIRKFLEERQSLLRDALTKHDRLRENGVEAVSDYDLVVQSQEDPGRALEEALQSTRNEASFSAALIQEAITKLAELEADAAPLPTAVEAKQGESNDADASPLPPERPEQIELTEDADSSSQAADQGSSTGDDRYIGKNRSGRDIRQDEHGVRSVDVGQGIFTTQKVAVPPGGLPTFLEPMGLYANGDYEYLTAEEYDQFLANDGKIDASEGDSSDERQAVQTARQEESAAVQGAGNEADSDASGQNTLDLAFDEPADGGETGENESAEGASGAGRVPNAGADGRPGSRRDATDGREGVSGAGSVDAGARDGSDRPDRVARPDTPPHFHIDDPVAVMGGGQVARFERNQRAIEILQDIEATGRLPNDEDKTALAGYTGWGSFGQELFQGSWDNRKPKDGWGERDAWLRDHLGRSEWESAQRSIINAHYTDPITVAAMWSMVERMGFRGGRVLEPSMGIGNFFGLMPRGLKSRSMLAGIELDELTGSMAKAIYPGANVQIKGYQDSKTPDDFYDVVIGNWPFYEKGPADRRYRKINPTLHDYFFLKAIDQVRPGGLVVGITSKGTMDKLGTVARLNMAKKAELVAAYRLPTGAFQDYAGTKVVTDIIILRKREEPVSTPTDGWIEIGEYMTPAGEPVKMNQYYIDNPDKVLGTVDYGHGTTTRHPGLIVHRPDNLEAALNRAVSEIPEGVYQKADRARHISYITNNTSDREGSITKTDAGLFLVQGEHLAPIDQVRKYAVKSEATTEKRRAQIAALVDMRRAYGELVDAERHNQPAEDARAELKGQFDAFVAEHGALNKSFGLGYLSRVGDPFYPSLAALERDAGKGNWEPAAILSGSTIRRDIAMDKPSVQDAFILARNSSVQPTLAEVASAANVTESVARQTLVDTGAVFELPGGDIVPADIYLSGNVREKLREAEAALADGEAVERNVEALKAVIPKDIPYHNIEVQMGATWIDPKYYKQWVAHMLNLDETSQIDVRFKAGRWSVRFPSDFNHLVEASSGFGSPHVKFRRLVNAAITNQTVKVHVKDEHGKPFVDPVLTKEANAKISEMRQKFGEWIWADPERRVALETEYNEARNAYATPVYDGSFMQMAGMALQLGDSPFNLRKHQQDAIWRAIVTRRSLNAHEVGTGKTFTMGGIALESRRYGIAKKPLLLAHNANSATVAAEIQMMYPAARILYINNLAPAVINTKLRQIANDDWDVVVMPHSLIDRLALSKDTLDALAREEIAELEEEARAAAADDGVEFTDDMLTDEDALKKLRSQTAKDMVKMRMRIQDNIDKQAQRASREGAVPFEELGIDMILVDEAHEFKKPPIVTQMNMKGLNTATSAKSIALRFLTQYVRANNGGANVHTFTGTPVTNTMTEVYHQMRYIMEEEMADGMLDKWDGWFGAFASEVTEVELNAAAEYEAVTRLAKFVNVPELRQMLGQYMDVVFSDEMPEMKPRTTESGKTIAAEDLTEKERGFLLNGRTEGAKDRPYKKVIVDNADMTFPQQQEFARIQQYARSWRAMTGKARRQAMREGSPESPIITEGLASKASLDIRLNDESLAGQEGKTEDDPNSKASRVVRNVLEIYGSSPLATQAIFMEIGIGQKVTRTKTGEDGEKTRTAHSVFSTATDIVERLVQGGIPRDEIAVVTGSTSKEKRKAIAAAMNTAEIRVVLGSSSTLGVGVNMQKNLRAMHHVDAPWMPGDLEQRNGRGHRQGNQWNTVLEYRYLTDRLDGRRWQVLAVKQRFITAFLTSKGNERIIEGDAASEDESDILSTFSEAAGDPRILLREKLKRRVEEFQQKERIYTQSVAQAIRNVRGLEQLIAEEQAQIVELEAVEAVASKALGDAKENGLNAVVHGKSVDLPDLPGVLKQLTEKNAKLDMAPMVIGELYGFPALITWPRFAESPVLMIQVEAAGKTVPIAGNKPTLASLQAAMRGISRKIQNARDTIDHSEKSLTRMQQVSQEPFAFADKLEQAAQDLRDLIADMEDNPVPPPAWLRAGAPVDSIVYQNGEERVVTGHRWTPDNWYVMVAGEQGSEPVPYTSVRDEQGMPLYDERPFEAPEVIEKSEQGDGESADPVADAYNTSVAASDAFDIERARDAISQVGFLAEDGPGEYITEDEYRSSTLSEPSWDEPGDEADGGPRPGTRRAPAISSDEDAEAARSKYRLQVRTREVGRVPVGVEKADTPEKAAHILATFRKQAQENVLVLVLDADDKPINVIRHTLGTTNTTKLESHVLIGAVADIQGAHSIYLSHNHPSGNATPSAADRDMTLEFTRLLGHIGVELRGHILLSPRGGKARHFYGHNNGTLIDIHKAPRRKSLSVVERVITRQKTPLMAMRSTTDVINLARSVDSPNAIFLLNTQRQPVAVLEVTQEELGNLRQGDRLPRMYRALHRANARGVVIKTNNRGAAANLAKWLNMFDGQVEILDWVYEKDDGSGELDTEKNYPAMMTLDQQRGTFYSKSATLSEDAKPRGQSKADVERAVRRFLKRYTGATPAEVRVVQRQSEWINDPDGIVKAGYEPETDRLTIVASNLDSARDAERTLQHELFVHKGLGLFSDSDIQTLLDGARESAQSGDGEMRRIWKEVQKDYAGESPQYQAEELLAKVAESTDFSPLKRTWHKFVQVLRNLLRKIGLLTKKASTRDFKDVVYWIADALAEGKQTRRRRSPARGDTAASRQESAPLGSVLLQAVESLKQSKAKPEQMMAAIAKQPGVKKEEIEWTGLDAFMDGIDGSVTKDEIVDYLSENLVRVDVMVADRLDVPAPRFEAATEMPLTTEQVGALRRAAESRPESFPEDQLSTFFDRKDAQLTAFRWPQYRVERWGVNSLELLVVGHAPVEIGSHVVMPLYAIVSLTDNVMHRGVDLFDSSRGNISFLANGIRGRNEALVQLRRLAVEFDFTTDSEDERLARWEQYVADDELGPSENYREVKFRLPDIPGDFVETTHFPDKNLVAFMRVTDRGLETGEGAQRNTFFIEELQSDWHQEGRQRGYRKQPLRAEDVEIKYFPPQEQPSSGYFETIDKRTGDQIGRFHSGASKESMIADSLADDRRILQRMVPDAPFKGDGWIALSLKEALRQAVNGGYAALAWADSVTLMKRWDGEYAELYSNTYDKKMVSMVRKLTGVKPVQYKGDGSLKSSLESRQWRPALHSEELGTWHIVDRFGTHLTDEDDTPEFAYSEEDAKELAKSLNAGERSANPVSGYWAIEITDELRRNVSDHGYPMFSRRAREEGDPPQRKTKAQKQA